MFDPFPHFIMHVSEGEGGLGNFWKMSKGSFFFFTVTSLWLTTHVHNSINVTYEMALRSLRALFFRERKCLACDPQ